jgi:hypothetical protein
MNRPGLLLLLLLLLLDVDWQQAPSPVLRVVAVAIMLLLVSFCAVAPITECRCRRLAHFTMSFGCHRRDSWGTCMQGFVAQVHQERLGWKALLEGGVKNIVS